MFTSQGPYLKRAVLEFRIRLAKEEQSIGGYTRRFAEIAFQHPMTTRYMSHTSPSSTKG